MDLKNRKSKTHDNNKQSLIREYDKSEKCEHNSDDCDRSIEKIQQNEVTTEETKIPEKQINHQQHFVAVQDALVNSKRIVINLEFDVVALLLFIAGIITRLYRLEEPRSVVFDELHYGKYVGLYMKNTFFFDTHPPLGKQLIAIVGYLAGFDGNFKFDRIGTPYDDGVPLFALRLVPAIFGSLILPTSYHLALELGLKPWSAAIAGLMLLLDNAFLTQSRFILMESMLIQFSLFGLYCFMKFRKVMDEPRKLSWWFWLTMSITSLTCGLCVKYVGIYSLFLGIFLICKDYWNLLGRKVLSNAFLWIHLIARIIVIILSIITIYFGVFYIHLTILTRAGPHDAVMTSAFQASLEGGLASITKGQPIQVTHGSQITLRHAFGRACWLHSHVGVYPIKYPDGRGSSHQQQVTCYSFKDVNNWWIVKRPDINDLVVNNPIIPLKHGDIIQLVHGISSRALNSHDVAGPMSPSCQEVSCYIDYNVSMPAQNLWKVDIVNREITGDKWHAIESQVRLVHEVTKSALKFSGRQLPDWGFNQHEVVADRIIEQEDTVWNVEEHRYTKIDDQKQREHDLLNAEMIPLKATTLTFWQKLIELQIKMFFSGNDNPMSHMYSSSPLEWPLMNRGIAYWVASDSNAQIHLLGNIIIWYSGTISVFIYSILLIFYLMRRRRCCFDISDNEWQRFTNIGQVLLVGYGIHYIPFFFVERTLFLHHYLPAFVFKIILTAATIDHIYYLIRNNCRRNLVVSFVRITILAWIVLIIYVFRKFLVLSYGMTPLKVADIFALRWTDTWDFIVHKTN